MPKTGKIIDLGITSRTGNITGLVERDGILYGLSGARTSVTKIFAYNIKTGEYKGYRQFKVYFHNTDKKYKWRPLHLKNLLLLKNGLIITGDDESNGHVYTYEPKKINWVKR